MNCDFERVEALFDDTLPENERQEMERHLEECPTCRAWYDTLQELRADLSAPEGFTKKVMEEVSHTRQKKSAAVRRVRRTVAALAACLVLVMAVQLTPLGQMLYPRESKEMSLAREGDQESKTPVEEESAAEKTETPEAEPQAEKETAPVSGETKKLMKWMARQDGSAAVGKGGLIEKEIPAEYIPMGLGWLSDHGIQPQVVNDHGRGYWMVLGDLMDMGAPVPEGILPRKTIVYLYIPANM